MTIKHCTICGNEFDAKGRSKTCSPECSVAIKKATNAAYKKDWKKKNPEKIAEYQRQNRANHPEKKKERDGRYRKKNRALLAEKSRKLEVQARRLLVKKFDVNPPDEIIEIKTTILRLKRELKNEKCQ